MLVEMDIQDEQGRPVNIKIMEAEEQGLAEKYIEENDVVLELGGRYGSVSCIINTKIKCKTNQVSVEPDERVWSALERNKKVNNCEFHIIKGFISKKKLQLSELNNCFGYGTTSEPNETSTIPSYTLEEIEAKFGLKFNVLVADCEGFLEQFFEENPKVYDEIRMCIFEADYPKKCNYDAIRKILKSKGFKCLQEGFQNVWKR
jgi:FkbM family methyltransferase